MQALTLTPTRLRAFYALLTATMLAATAVVASADGSWAMAIGALVAPDLPLLAGGGQGLAKGQLHPRAVPLYNAAHRFWGPALLAVLVPVAGLGWAAHVALDRSVGYGLRTDDGFQRGA